MQTSKPRRINIRSNERREAIEARASEFISGAIGKYGFEQLLQLDVHRRRPTPHQTEPMKKSFMLEFAEPEIAPSYGGDFSVFLFRFSQVDAAYLNSNDVDREANTKYRTLRVEDSSRDTRSELNDLAPNLTASDSEITFRLFPIALEHIQKLISLDQMPAENPIEFKINSSNYPETPITSFIAGYRCEANQGS